MKSLILVALFALPSSALAEDITELGTTNPEEMTWGSNMARVQRGDVDMNICASGYMMTKSGDHAAARAIFTACAAAGYTGAMTWMGQLDNNGLGAHYNPDAAADWDKRAADAGDPVGKFNYGLALMRGHGVAMDEALGRRYVDEAAQEGLQIAKRLQRADYDLDEVTPDADNWKYAPLF
ncbi:MAG: tetratricopeptide repeat protein [Primorskyibacter sp.]